MPAGEAWGCLLCSLMRDLQGSDRIHAERMTLPLTRKGGPLAQGMDMVAEALSGVRVDPDDRSGPFRRMRSMIVYVPSRMVRYGTVPGDPARVATMVALAGMAEAVPGSSARKSDAVCMGAHGPAVAWGYDGPDLSAGFMRSLVADTWADGIRTPEGMPKGRGSLSDPEPSAFPVEPPAFPVELVASITGGKAPGRADILHAESLEHASDLPYCGSRTDDDAPGSPLSMDAGTLKATAGLRDRMGGSWPMMGMLRGRFWNHPFIPSMADMRFLVRDMDWSLPPAADGPEHVILSFLDAMDDGAGGFLNSGIWFSGHALASWSASLHDPAMTAATPAAAAHVDRIAGMLVQGLDGPVEGDDDCDDPMLDAAALDVVRGLAPLHGMPDGFVRETAAGMLHGRMRKDGRHGR